MKRVERAIDDDELTVAPAGFAACELHFAPSAGVRQLST